MISRMPAASFFLIGLTAALASAQLHPDFDRPPGIGEPLDSPPLRLRGQTQPATAPTLPLPLEADDQRMKSLRQLVHIAVHDREIAQLSALEKIATFKDEAVLFADDIRALLDSPSADVSRAAAKTLAAMGGGATRQWFDAVQSSDGFTRLLALRAIADLTVQIDPDFAPVLRAAIVRNFDDSPSLLHTAAAKALCRFWPASAEVLVQSIQAGDADVRAILLEKILADPNAFLGEKPLWTALFANQVPRGRPSNELLIALGKEFDPDLLNHLSLREEPERRKALEVINRLPPKAVGDKLERILVLQMSGKNSEYAHDAAQLLSHLGPVAIPGLIEGSHSLDPVVRRICVNALGERIDANSSPEALAVMKNALVDFDINIRAPAFAWLRKLSTPPKGLVEILADGLSSDAAVRFTSSRERAVVAEALGRFAVEPKTCVPALAQMLDDEDPDTQIAVCRALCAFGNEAGLAMPELTKLLATPNPTVGAEAITTLSHIGSEGRLVAAKYYDDRLAHLEEAEGRMQTIQALAYLGPDAAKAVPSLEKLLSSDDNALRIEVARALAAIGPKAAGALPALNRMMDNHSPEVRQAASEALVKISPDGKGLRPALMAAVYNGDRAAANRLAAIIQRAGDTAPLILQLNALATDDPDVAVRSTAKYAVEWLSSEPTPASTTKPGDK